MALSDILTIPFLISLGITLLLVSVVVMFCIQRFQEQNHKISSMVGLVSTMAEELNFVRGRIHLLINNDTTNNLAEVPISQNGGNHNLISVSDDEDDSDDEDSDSDSDSDIEEDLDNLEEDENLEINISANDLVQNIKVINLSESSFNNAFDAIDSDHVSVLSELSEDDDNVSVMSELSDDKTVIHLKRDEDDDDLKSVQFSNLDEKKESENIDYKKMSINKLRSLILEKGLSTDTTKLKKPELIKLLGIE